MMMAIGSILQFLDGVPPESDIAKTEIFGPVLSLMHAETVDDAIAMVNNRAYGNMACIFHQSSGAVRTQIPL